jgi:hypothetical protein
VFIRALTDVTAGEELFIDYLLEIKGRQHGGIDSLLGRSSIKRRSSRCL